jgi:hypothetical protein
MPHLGTASTLGAPKAACRQAARRRRPADKRLAESSLPKARIIVIQVLTGTQSDAHDNDAAPLCAAADFAICAIAASRAAV